MKRIANSKENRMDQVLEEFSKIGIIPVIALEDAADEMCIRDRQNRFVPQH